MVALNGAEVVTTNFNWVGKLIGFLIILALASSALVVTPALAAGSESSSTLTFASTSTSTVTINADSSPGSLRQAIANASNGDTITFDNDYTITLASQLEIINKTITITGAGHHITISGNNAVRVFYVGDGIHGSGNLIIDHLNIVNGASKVDECAGSAVA